MKIIELKDKIIYFEDFFKRASGELREKTGLTQFHFLMRDDENEDFVTQYSTYGLNISLTKKELRLLGNEFEKEIFYPKIMSQRYDFWRRISLIKINWKIQWYGISVIMPIHSEGKIICLILFTDQLADDWFYKNSYYTSIIGQNLTHCLESIFLYNKTLERLIREHEHSSLHPNCRVAELTDEQTPVLIGKKVEFL